MTRRALAIAALVAGALASFAGSPYRGAEATLDVARLAAVVEAEEDHVTAVELAQWIRERKAGLEIVDLRERAAFDDFHVPTSRNVALQTLVATRFAPSDTIVLISDGGAHAAQAWVFLRALGHPRVYFLRGGLREWLDDVMNPVNPSATQAELSRYFGGQPRIDDSQPLATDEVIVRMRRRGC